MSIPASSPLTDSLEASMEFELPPGEDPRGICGTCKFFIDDTQELLAELEFQARQRHVLIQTERLGTGQWVAQHRPDGGVDRIPVPAARGAVVRTIRSVPDLCAALAHQFPGLSPFDLGLCEIGVATLVFAPAGYKTPPGCSKWQPQSKTQARDPRWRERRLELLGRGQVGLRQFTPDEPCPCNGGKTFGQCHGAALPMKITGE